MRHGGGGRADGAVVPLSSACETLDSLLRAASRRYRELARFAWLMSAQRRARTGTLCVAC